MSDRQSMRLRDYDYTRPGSYFVTVCEDKRRCLFGEVVDGHCVLNPLGVLIERELLMIPRRRSPWIVLGEFVVMPNHVHVVIINRRGSFRKGVRAGRGAIHRARLDRQRNDPKFEPGPVQGDSIKTEELSLGVIVGNFKAGVTREARRLGYLDAVPFKWQRNFFDHVVRSEESLRRINHYIRNNPRRWHLDRENPARAVEDEFDRWLDEEGKKPL